MVYSRYTIKILNVYYRIRNIAIRQYTVAYTFAHLQYTKTYTERRLVSHESVPTYFSVYYSGIRSRDRGLVIGSGIKGYGVNREGIDPDRRVVPVGRPVRAVPERGDA